jgi:hypothetical protein
MGSPSQMVDVAGTQVSTATSTTSYRFLLNHLQIHIPSSINTIQEAESLLQSTHQLWAACQADSSVALSQLQQAYEEFSVAEHQLRTAEIRVGEARSTVRRSGFGHLLPLTESYFPTVNMSGKQQIAPAGHLTSDAFWLPETDYDVTQVLARISLD